MEPFPKRQRIYSTAGPSFPQSFDSEEAYYDDDDFVVGEEEEEDYEEQIPDLDPESDFQQKRARLDYKLKSTFESIFEKYGRDFEGVGDEIDLATGEIVVNNGHLLQMVDERDAGDVSREQSVPTEVTEESEDLPSSALELNSDLDEDNEGEEEEDGSEEGSEDMVMEDDLIRGFAQANRFKNQPSPESGSVRHPVVQPQQTRRTPAARPATQKKALPSRSEILARFGPELGPQIVDYVSKQSVPDNSHVEPAWRAPDIPAFKARHREVKRPIIMAPSPERSPSPGEPSSIWAAPRQRGPKRIHVTGAGNMEERTAVSRQQYDVDSFDIGDLEYGPESRRKRNAFTEEEDQIMLDWVTHARRKGEVVSGHMWRELGATYPRHSWRAWKQHYDHQFTYLVSNSIEDTEVSEPSMDSPHVASQIVPARAGTMSHSHSQREPRPNRIRKPAQKDSRIISWSEAVNALESLDPDQHAAILEDAREAGTEFPDIRHPALTSTGHNAKTAITTGIRTPKTTHIPKLPPKEVIDLTDDLSDMDATPVSEPEDPLIPGAPCPHADCRGYPTIMYRLQRRDDEQLSEMCLHLFRVHHTTPFPCGETNCQRKGEEGYFMQADLVKHVRKAHPGVGALQRLRGRVDSELLDRNIELEASPTDRPATQQRNSDFMSPNKTAILMRPSSSHHQSSFSDNDRTPRAASTILGGSRSTPMTSVSSMRVHHASATKLSIEDEVEDDNLQYKKYMDDLSMRARRSTVSSGGVGSHHHHASSEQRYSPSHKGKEIDMGARNSLPTPKTSMGDLLGPSDDKERRRGAIAGQQRKFGDASRLWKPVILIEETPNPSSSQVRMSSQTHATLSAASSIKPIKNPRKAMQTMQRNTLDPAYEFSDEEIDTTPRTLVAESSRNMEERTARRRAPHLGPPPSIQYKSASGQNPGTDPAIEFSGNIDFTSQVQSATAPSNVGTFDVKPPSPSMGPPPPVGNKHHGMRTPIKTYSKKKQRAVKSFATPDARTVVRESLLRMAMDTEDFDELSLDTDGIALLSSRPRTTPLDQRQTTIKQEDLMNTPRPLARTGTKKRTFNAFRDASSPDELQEGEPTAKKATGATKTKVKEEEELSLPSLPNHRIQQVRKDAVSSSHPTPSMSMSRRDMPIRTSTPLLNLTPTRRSSLPKEILDSVRDSSSPPPSATLNPPQRPRAVRQKEAHYSSSPPTDLLTPTRKEPTRDLLKAEQVTVVVKTPGGTFRRCGEDGFACGRSFCFRCGSQDVSMST